VTSGIIGTLFWWMAGSLLIAIVVGIVAFIFALSTGGRIGPGGYYSGRGPLGGGGGFKGGGGGFGGGGASGRW
jgi:uncharacterized protein